MAMRRTAWIVAPVLVVALSAAPVRAQSAPVINVQTFGLELCPQSICGAAIFSGLFFGRVGSNPRALGTFIVGVIHETPLPEPGNTIDLLGGQFELRVGLRRLRGEVSGGTLLANPDNTFFVDAELTLQSGDQLRFQGVLDHNVFPPTIIGGMASQ
jgi:hypothetical protein